MMGVRLTLPLMAVPVSAFPRSSIQTQMNWRTKGVTAFGVNPSESKKEALFLEENGAVDDMDGYLNQLSLEYDSVWDTKPSWCQPWTITLTGVSLVNFAFSASYFTRIITNTRMVVHLPLFLPQGQLSSQTLNTLVFSKLGIERLNAYSEMIAERRERVTNGVEDTYGRTKKQ
ncbi:hypothetical protein Ahy_A06g026483 isoform A [Arachis hypogaea]|uniref:DUF6737 domain-containing protein n=1 Tax=Arachis hypogaea TaxID=3818 RepID=A0A445CKM3_ARAHY|nr:hypothetical protein Ahy_A06g026483 isoform A [Arachis hypogaea]